MFFIRQSTYDDWIFQHPWQMLLIDHSCSVNGAFWHCFFPNVLKIVLCSGHSTECVLCCRYRWVCGGETLLQGEHDVYEHTRLLYVCLQHRLCPDWWLLLHRWVKKSLKCAFFCQGIIRVERRGMGHNAGWIQTWISQMSTMA